MGPDRWQEGTGLTCGRVGLNMRQRCLLPSYGCVLARPSVCRARLIVAELAGGSSGGPAAGVVPAATNGAAALRDKVTVAFPGPPVACSGAQASCSHAHTPFPRKLRIMLL